MYLLQRIFSMSRFLINKYQSLDVYTPGEQPKDMEYVKLNTNESPYPPSSGVLRAISDEEISKLNLYPDPEGVILREKIAKLYDVKKESVFLSNGSDDILNFSFMAFCSGECKAVFPNISYGFYKVFSDLHGVDYDEIPLKEDFSIDVNDYVNIGKTVVIANPNAPTGLMLTVGEVEKIVSSNLDNVVVIDEAYIDFGGESCVPLTKKYDNLLVVQTFSKSRSMAGARLGFAIASKELIDDLNRIKYSTNPYNINRLTLIAGSAAIDENDYYLNCCKKIINTREYTKKKLTELGFTYLDSMTNFIFARSDKIGGEEYYKKLKGNGVLVRHFANPVISDYVRITIGTREQMDTLFEATKKILGSVF